MADPERAAGEDAPAGRLLGVAGGAARACERGVPAGIGHRDLLRVAGERVVLVARPGERECGHDRDERDRGQGDRALQDAEAHRLRAATISPNDSRTRLSKSTGRTPSGEANSRR